jgi:hypothetical protein
MLSENLPNNLFCALITPHSTELNEKIMFIARYREVNFKTNCMRFFIKKQFDRLNTGVDK